jgi:hypothetical protein
LAGLMAHENSGHTHRNQGIDIIYFYRCIFLLRNLPVWRVPAERVLGALHPELLKCLCPFG